MKTFRGASCVLDRIVVLVEQPTMFYALTLQAREHRKFAVAEGDHLTMLNVYEAFIKVTCLCMYLVMMVNTGVAFEPDFDPDDATFSPTASEELPVVS